jgi:hypothetical protein
MHGRSCVQRWRESVLLFFPSLYVFPALHTCSLLRMFPLPLPPCTCRLLLRLFSTGPAPSRRPPSPSSFRVQLARPMRIPSPTGPPRSRAWGAILCKQLLPILCAAVRMTRCGTVSVCVYVRGGAMAHRSGCAIESPRLRSAGCYCWDLYHARTPLGAVSKDTSLHRDDDLGRTAQKALQRQQDGQHRVGRRPLILPGPSA